MKHFIKVIYAEVLVIFIYIFLLNNYIGNTDTYITGDGIGYYDYLPSAFIHHDITRKKTPFNQDTQVYKRIDTIAAYVDYQDFKVNKYACGTAILQLPFFASAKLFSDTDTASVDGYQMPFQKAVFYATLFYLFLSLFFLKKTLELYHVKMPVILFTQLVLVLGTTVTNYASYEAGFSHIYSLFAVTAFVYFSVAYFKQLKLSQFVLASVFLGLVVLIRQLNILVVFSLPFLAGSWSAFKGGVIAVMKNYKMLITGIFLFMAMASIQLILWYLQTGKLFLYSYQNEGFYFSSPEIIKILFSYRKGLFVYTPVLLVTLAGIGWLFYKKDYFKGFSWLFFFLLITYIFSSWWSWYYGASYGMRVFIEYYPFFFIPFAIMLSKVNIKFKLLLAGIALLLIPVNVIQAYQYKEYILHKSKMDKEKYWKVFLKTHEKYHRLVWKRDFDENQYTTAREIVLGDIRMPRNSIEIIFSYNSSNIPDFEKVSILQLIIDNDYRKSNDTKFILNINNNATGFNYYYKTRYLIHLHNNKLNEWQTGFYNFEFHPIADKQEKLIELMVLSGKQDIELKNTRIRFLIPN